MKRDSELKRNQATNFPALPRGANSHTLQYAPGTQILIPVVFCPVSRFTDVTTLKLISPDLLDLFDNSNDSMMYGKRTLVEMCRASKKRRRRILKSVSKKQYTS